MIRFLVCLLTFSYVFGQTLDELLIPRKTAIFITLQRTINTKTAQSGDKFFGRIAVPITSNDRIVIPASTYVIGHVHMSKQPGHIKGKAELLLAFDSIVLPDGTTRQIEAVVQSAEGYQTDQSGELGELKSSGSQGKETASGAAGGAISGGAIGAIAGRSLKGLAVGTGIGSGAGTLLGLFKKGDQVILQKGTSLTIQLQTDIRFVKPTPRKRGVPLSP
ncbi:hypothetical protein MYX78_10800 [Acidobacteria bacterium AH-259-G07]|nr:hypothetical protein [Acidobacteria bacterium AH-259-G07]